MNDRSGFHASGTVYKIEYYLWVLIQCFRIVTGRSRDSMMVLVTKHGVRGADRRRGHEHGDVRS